MKRKVKKEEEGWERVVEMEKEEMKWKQKEMEKENENEKEKVDEVME
jgi:hypothetical protein